ncbi:MerR family transcriptional regulator [Ectothiorhodospiraceae bacterium 2226]|nr:MerR family transcriptional regulator [Ectothiorhodospiraceae bacterium 2226]
MSEASGMTIGGLARAAGVSVETIRFYQRKGLVPQPARRYGTVRRYGDPVLARIRFIKAAQRLGFSLEGVAALLALEDGAECKAARRLAEAKLREVRLKLADLHRIEAVLAGLVHDCATSDGAVRCPLIEAVQQGGV